MEAPLDTELCGALSSEEGSGVDDCFPNGDLNGATILDLGDGYKASVGGVDAHAWLTALAGLDDANIYQAWAYMNVCHGKSKVARILVSKDGSAVGMVQARIVMLPMLKRGIAFVRWGPLWRAKGQPANRMHLRKCLKAIFLELAVRRRLLVRLIPLLYAEKDSWAIPLFQEEGFSFMGPRYRRTLIMNLNPSLEEIHDNLHVKWRAHLKRARKKPQQVVEGQGDALFAAFEKIYRSMRNRKGFVTFTDFTSFRNLQAQLSPKERMTVIMCGSDSDYYSGAIVTSLGNMGLYLFGATDGSGLENNASYLVQWRAIELLKERGCEEYDLNGINPESNPTTYQYKTRLAGKDRREVRELGTFEACSDPLSRIATRIGTRCLESWRALRQRHGRSRSITESGNAD